MNLAQFIDPEWVQQRFPVRFPFARRPDFEARVARLDAERRTRELEAAITARQAEQAARREAEAFHRELERAAEAKRVAKEKARQAAVERQRLAEAKPLKLTKTVRMLRVLAASRLPMGLASIVDLTSGFGIDSRHAAALLLPLKARGVVERTGRSYHYLYRLTQKGRALVDSYAQVKG